MQKRSLLILSALLLSSCGSVPNVPICKELDINRGYCVWTVEDREQYVDDTNLLNGKTWWEMRPTMVLVPAESWVEIKSFVIKLCEKSNQCNGKENKWDY